MSKRRLKFVTKILRKTRSSLVKIISDGEINFKQNKYIKLQKISATMGSSTVQLQYVCKTKFTSKIISGTSFRKGEYVYKIHIQDWVYYEHTVTKNMEICDLKSYTRDLINILFK